MTSVNGICGKANRNICIRAVTDQSIAESTKCVTSDGCEGQDEISIVACVNSYT